MSSSEQTVLDADAVARVIRRVALEIVERCRGIEGLALVGVRRGGPAIAERIAAEIRSAEGRDIPVGSVDIGLYRDDSILPDPKGPNRIDFEVRGRDVVLVDDVLHTGRTVRAAIDCLMDYGRPGRVWLAVLCDRGGRELPVAADFVGRVLEVGDHQVLEVIADGGEDDAVLLRDAPERRPGGGR